LYPQHHHAHAHISKEQKENRTKKEQNKGRTEQKENEIERRAATKPEQLFGFPMVWKLTECFEN
jgi:hypothetical protein